MTNDMTPDTLAERLLATAILKGGIDGLGAGHVTSLPCWAALSSSWNNLARDTYMADGGTYRSRRYSEFALRSGTDVAARLPHVPYRQEVDVNYLNGGIDRHYPAIEPTVADSESFQTILMKCWAVLERLHPGASWKAQVFQNRIHALPTASGSPTPEGIHRDGVDYVLTMLVGRQGIRGGESSTYPHDDHSQPLDTVTLSQPGDFIFLDDDRVMHAVTPIEVDGTSELGYRDVLVAMFSRTR